VDAQQLAEQSRRILRVATRFDVARARVIGAAAIASGDVKVALITRSRAETDPAAIVIGLRLIERQQRRFAVRIRYVGIGGDGKFGNMTNTSAE
jgi:hypothetical protein